MTRTGSMAAAAMIMIILGCHTAKPVQQAETSLHISTAEQEEGLTLIASDDCLTCHRIADRNIGPSFSDIGRRYKPTTQNIKKLTVKIQKGGSGKWGNVPMTAHPSLNAADAARMLKFILAQHK